MSVRPVLHISLFVSGDDSDGCGSSRESCDTGAIMNMTKISQKPLSKYFNT